MNRYTYTKNPFRKALAEVRYTVGNYVRDHVATGESWQDENNRIRYAVWEWGYNSEGACNCLLQPLLGKIIKWERKAEKVLNVWHPLHMAQDPKAARWLTRYNKFTDRKDHYLKLDNPDYESRLDLMANFEKLARRLGALDEKS